MSQGLNCKACLQVQKGDQNRNEAEIYLNSAHSSARGNDICMFFCNNGSVVQVEGNTEPKLNWILPSEAYFRFTIIKKKNLIRGP